MSVCVCTLAKTGINAQKKRRIAHRHSPQAINGRPRFARASFGCRWGVAQLWPGNCLRVVR
eukprot:5948774-Lingulodinium_polyedra.AAC.1